MTGERYGRVHERVFAVGDPVAVAVYAALALHADRAGHARPSLATLADGLGCSTRTVSRAVRVLVDAEVVTVRTGRGQRASWYFLPALVGAISGANLSPLRAAETRQIRPLVAQSASPNTTPVSTQQSEQIEQSARARAREGVRARARAREGDPARPVTKCGCGYPVLADPAEVVCPWCSAPYVRSGS